MMPCTARTLAECWPIACHVRIKRANPISTRGINSHGLLVCCKSKSSAPVPTSPKIRIVKSRRRIVKREFGILLLGATKYGPATFHGRQDAPAFRDAKLLDVSGSYKAYRIFHNPRVGFRFHFDLHHDGAKNSSLGPPALVTFLQDGFNFYGR